MFNKAMKVINKAIVVVLVLGFTLLGVNFSFPRYIGTVAYAEDETTQQTSDPSPTPTDTPKPTETPTPTDTPATDEPTSPDEQTGVDAAIPSENIAGVELLDQRTEFSKVYKLENGKFAALVSGLPIHYLENGVYEDIDNSMTLQTDKDGKQKYVNKHNSFKAEIPSALDNFSISRDKYKLSWTVDGITKNKNGIKTDPDLSKEAWGMMTEGQKRSHIPNFSSDIKYKDAMDGIDLQYVVVSNRVVENIILNSKKDIKQITQHITAENLKLIKNKDGSINAVDAATSEVIFVLPAPFMTDSDGNRCDNVSVDLTFAKNEYILKYTLDKDWLKNAVYPVIVDPSCGPDYHDNCIDTKICEAYPGYNYNTTYILTTGYGSSSHMNYSLVKYTNLPFDDPILW